MPAARSAASIRKAVVVLPFVPVTPTRLRALSGWPCYGGGKLGERRARVAHLDPLAPVLGWHLGDDDDGTLAPRRLDEAVPVAGLPANGHEQRVRLHLARVVDDVRNRACGIAAPFDHIELVAQLCEGHVPSPRGGADESGVERPSASVHVEPGSISRPGAGLCAVTLPEPVSATTSPSRAALAAASRAERPRRSGISSGSSAGPPRRTTCVAVRQGVVGRRKQRCIRPTRHTDEVARVVWGSCQPPQGRLRDTRKDRRRHVAALVVRPPRRVERDQHDQRGPSSRDEADERGDVVVLRVAPGAVDLLRRTCLAGDDVARHRGVPACPVAHDAASSALSGCRRSPGR